jgi:hypothetical protein
VELARGWGTWCWKGKVFWRMLLGVEGVTEEMVEKACRAALFHEFVRD